MLVRGKGLWTPCAAFFHSVQRDEEKWSRLLKEFNLILNETACVLLLLLQRVVIVLVCSSCSSETKESKNTSSDGDLDMRESHTQVSRNVEKRVIFHESIRMPFRRTTRGGSGSGTFGCEASGIERSGRNVRSNCAACDKLHDAFVGFVKSELSDLRC